MTERASLNDSASSRRGSRSCLGLGAVSAVVATALATAISRVNESEMATASTPCSRATSAARPDSRARGLPEASEPTVTSL